MNWEKTSLSTALWIGALNNDATLEMEGSGNGELDVRIVGDPTEGALLVAAAKVGALQQSLLEAYPRVQEIPFDSARKRMITFHRVLNPRKEDASPFDETVANRTVVVLKGAPDVVLNLCAEYESIDDLPTALTEETKAAVLAANDAMTRDALRVLGVAYRVVDEIPADPDSDVDAVEQHMIFAGLIGMIDPPRPEARLRQLHQGMVHADRQGAAVAEPT